MKIYGAVMALILVARVQFLDAADSAAGKAVYDANCKSCHGAKGEGNQLMAGILGVKFRHLGSRAVQAKTDDQLKENAIKGTNKIKKNQSNLTDSQILDVVTFVRTLALR